MKWSVPIGRAWGIPIRIHVSFVLLLLWVAWLGWKVGGWTTSLWALVFVGCLFACVVLHELGHSLVAMRFGSEVRSVTLLPIGGVANMKSIPEKPCQELLVSLAGPSVNVLIVILLALLRGGFPSWRVAHLLPSGGAELADALIRANVVLAVFNLVPAFPMDGGRVLRSLLAIFLPYPRATAVAATMGQLLAILFIVVGLLANPFLVVIGIFVFLGAESEERTVRIRDMLRDVYVEDVMVTDFAALRPEDAIGRCLEYVYHHKQEDFPVEADGRLVGLLARKDWLSALHEEGAEARVGDVMLRHFVSLQPATPLSRFYRDLWRMQQSFFPVVGEGGRVVGLLTAEDIGRFLVVQQARHGRHPGPPRAGPRASRFTIDLG